MPLLKTSANSKQPDPNHSDRRERLNDAIRRVNGTDDIEIGSKLPDHEEENIDGQTASMIDVVHRVGGTGTDT